MWRTRLKLQPGETTRLIKHRDKGSLGQREVELWEIYDDHGQATGTVEFTEAISLKPPFEKTYALRHQDPAGNLIFADNW